MGFYSHHVDIKIPFFPTDQYDIKIVSSFSKFVKINKIVFFSVIAMILIKAFCIQHKL